MRRLASRTMLASCASVGSPDSVAPSTASTATAEATSPAFAPPIPSATANRGGSTTSESSLALRWRPTSVRPACSMMRRATATALLLVAVFAVAYANRVAHLEPLRRLHLTAIQVGPVRGAHVLHVHEFGAREDARVGRRGEGVVHADLRAVGAAHRRALADVEGRTRLVAHRGHHVQARAHSRAQVGAAALAPPRAREVHRLGRGSGALVARQVAHGAAHHPQEEEIENGEEAELERDRERFVHPLVELEGQVRDADRDLVAGPERLVVHPPAVHLDAVRRAEVDDLPAALLPAQLGVTTGYVRILEHDVGLPAATDDDAAPAEDVAAPAPHEERLTALVNRLQLARLAARRVDHRVAEVA